MLVSVPIFNPEGGLSLAVRLQEMELEVDKILKISTANSNGRNKFYLSFT
jgi:hypothetical protein